MMVFDSMRICLIAHRFYEVNTHMRQFATAFTERGDIVDVISVGRKGSPKYERFGQVNVFRIQERENDENYPVDYLVKLIAFVFRSGVFIARRHLIHKYDLVHVQSVPDFLVFSALVPKVLGAKVILDLRDLVPELYASKFNVSSNCLSVRLLKLVEKLSSCFADHVIIANPIWYERVVSRSVEPSRASVYWYYPDRNVFYPRIKARSDNKYVIMYPGSLSQHQGLDIAIRALPSIVRKIPEAELHIVGEGTEKRRLIGLSEILGLTDRVHFSDPVPTEDIVHRMKEADLGLVPKRGGKSFGNEAASTKIPEFMAMGIPVVATRTDIESQLYDSSCVCYFRSEDETDLAKAVISVYQDSQLRSSLITNGLDYIARNHWILRINEYVKLVRSIVNDPDGISGCKATNIPEECHPPSIHDPLFDLYKYPERYIRIDQYAKCDDVPFPSSLSHHFFALKHSFDSSALRCDSFRGCQTEQTSVCNHDDSDYPISTSDVVDYLRYERYMTSSKSRMAIGSILNGSYYSLRSWLPTVMRRRLQKAWVADWRDIPFPKWPVDTSVEKFFERLVVRALCSDGCKSLPFIWFWPNGYSSCAAITHDVESRQGRDFCSCLMDMDESKRVRSSFQLIPEGSYSLPETFLETLIARGFEINVHDLKHDGRLFNREGDFRKRAEVINRYGREWRASGFRAAVMYHVLDWYDALDFSYDMSVCNVAHLEAQRGGCCTVFPYFVNNILEIPLTTVQDYALFHYLGRYDIDLWRQQFDIIKLQHGLACYLVHPDYIVEDRSKAVYSDLLEFLSEQRDSENVWLTSPGDVNEWWRARDSMKLVRKGNNWQIEGFRSEEACIGYASLDGERLHFHVGNQDSPEGSTS